jgi:hypothetical protein
MMRKMDTFREKMGRRIRRSRRKNCGGRAVLKAVAG